jgi:hypothetical protein
MGRVPARRRAPEREFVVLGGGAAEVAEPEAVKGMGPVQPSLRLDPVCNAFLQIGERRVRLGLSDAASSDGLIDPLLRRSDECVHEPVNRLALVPRNLGETLAVLQLGTKLRLGEPEVRRRRIQITVPGAMSQSTDERKVVGLNSLLELIALLLRQLPGGDSLVDAIAERLPQRIAELARRDAELFGCVVDDALALFGTRAGLRCSDCGAATPGDRERSRGNEDLVLSVQIQIHVRVPLSV